MFSTTEITSSKIASDNPVHQRLFFAYVEAAKKVQDNLLEVGCGIGRGLALLTEKVSHYTAIDKNQNLIEQLQKEYPQNTFIAQNIPPFSTLKDNTYDFVVSFQVIEHIQKDEDFIKEIYRVLKKGGKFLVTTPNRLLSLTRNPWHIREYTSQELETLILKYFPKVEKLGVMGNEKVMDYYEKNKKSVKKFTRWDIFNLQYALPSQILRIPYDILNRMNRKKLQKINTGLVSEIRYDDYFLSEKPEESLDLFFIAEK
jgi:ubiquinone/menaquinone biosynthesis C-methylase UbiE